MYTNFYLKRFLYITYISAPTLIVSSSTAHISTRLSSVLRDAYLNPIVTVALYLLYALDRSLDAAVNIYK